MIIADENPQEMKNKLRDIVCGSVRERRFVEGLTVGGVLSSLIKITDGVLYIYGGGNDIESVVLYFQYLGLQIKGIIDADENKKGYVVLDSVPYIHISELKEHINSDDNNWCIINTVHFCRMQGLEITRLLQECGINNIYVLSEVEKYQIKGHNPAYKQYNFQKWFRGNLDKLEASLDLLYDRESKEAFVEYVRVYVQIGIYHKYQCDGRYKYFYGIGDDTNKEEIYKKYDDEVWLNCGANIGDSIFLFYANKLSARKIYAFEGDESIFRELLDNIKYLPQKMKEEIIPINKYIDSNISFDDFLQDRISLINADIEGGEMDLLRSVKEIIVRDRPVIAICIYHKAEDLVEIPSYLKDLVNDYRFIIRKYQASAYSINEAAELVLYAIPPERWV